MDLSRRSTLFKHCLYKYHFVEIPRLYCCAAFHVAYLCLVGNTCVCFFERKNIWQANAWFGNDCWRIFLAGGELKNCLIYDFGL